jgi:hypothetical protein
MTDNPTMPVFVFQRRHDIELEADFILAGQLIVDLPKNAEPKERHQWMVRDIVAQLTKQAQSGAMAHDALVFGWPDGRRPANADAIMDDDALLAAWAKERLAIAVRVDPRKPDGMLRLDSDVLRQMKITR